MRTRPVLPRRWGTLRPHQEAVLRRLLTSRALLLCWWMRAGKTDPIAMVSTRRAPTLVVTLKEACTVWDEALAHLKHPDYDVVNYESVHRYARVAGSYRSIVLDEVQRLRNHRGAFYHHVATIARKTPYRYAATGTMFDRDLLEVFGYWRILDDGAAFGTSHSAFLQKWGRLENPRSPHPKWTLHPALKDKFLERMRPLLDIRRQGAEDTRDPAVIVTRYPITSHQRATIAALRSRTALPFFDGDNAEFPFAVILTKIYQACSGFLIDTPTSRTTSFDTPKWDHLRELLTSRYPGRRVVVWVRYIHERERILHALCGSRKALAYTPDALARFRRGECDTLVAHPRSAGAGIDMSCADACVYVSEADSGIDAAQSQARMQFYGDQTRKETVFMLAKGVTETEALRKRMSHKTKTMEEFYAKT